MRSLGFNPELPQYADPVHYVAAAAITITAVFNYTGVKWSSMLVNVTTIAKYGALVLLVILAFTVGGGDFSHYAGGGADGPVEPRLFGLALISVLWAYDGWGDISFVG